MDSNNEFFPSELSQDKFQKRVISLEEQMKIKMHTMKEKESKTKKNKKGQTEIPSRKESSIDMLIANYLIELPKRKVFDEKQIDESKKLNTVAVEDEDEQESGDKEEENDEEPSYEDDYRVDSEGDNGVSEGDHYSDGGVF